MTLGITRPVIDYQLDLLNRNLAQCPCLTGAYLRVGLSVWRPGDGWTRYQLVTAPMLPYNHPANMTIDNRREDTAPAPRYMIAIHR